MMEQGGAPAPLPPAPVPAEAPAPERRAGHAEPAPEPRGRGAVFHGDSRLRRVLCLADFAAVSASLALACLAANRDVEPVGAAVWVLFVVASMKAMGLYDRDAHLLHKSTLDELPRLLVVSLAASFAALAAEGLIAEPPLTGFAGVELLFLLGALTPSARALTRRLSRRALPQERCVFVGSPVQAASLTAAFAATPGVRASIVATIDRREGSNRRRLGSDGITEVAERLVETAEAHGADRIILTAELTDVEELLATIRRLNQRDLKVSVAPGPGHLMQASVELDRLGGTALLGVHGFQLSLSSRALKRSLDVLASSIALMALAPIMLAVAVAIKLDSRGPILFRQVRSGRSGRSFTMHKFRSMVDGAEAQQTALAVEAGREVLFKMESDPRVTRVGRVIRRWSLDELPQLFDVLRGAMSLVGPRPLPVEQDLRTALWSEERLADVKPGLTGPWQVLVGVNRVPLEDMIRLDVQYVSRWSLWNDVRVLMLTIGHVLQRRGH